MFNWLADLLFPRHCLVCGRRGIDGCPDCLALLPAATENLNGIVALFPYHHTVISKAIRRLKYGGRRDHAELFGRLLFERLLEDLADSPLGAGPIMIVPVPLSAKRQRERGFNQAADMAKGLAKMGGVRLAYEPNLLTKIRDTLPQARLKRSQRLENVHLAFVASEEARGKTIVVVDDVTTTGATLSEARRALKKAGARRVFLAAVAHG